MTAWRSCAVVMAGLLAVPALAGETVLALDPQASEVTFTLGATLHRVHGSFQVTEGELRVDRESGKASGRVVIDATSGATGNKKRDRDMHVKVLESQKYPEIVFELQGIEGEALTSGSGTLSLSGTLHIHGGRHPLRIPAVVERAGDRLQGRASFRVPYVEWGLTDPSFLMLRVEKHVDVQIKAVGRLQEPG